MKRLALLVVLLLLAASPTPAATDEAKCINGIVKAKIKLEECVYKWAAKQYVAGSVSTADDVQKRLSKCRERFNAVWPKLAALGNSPTCGGKARFADNGLSVTDHLTGLTWAKFNDDDDSVLYWETSYALINTDREDGSAFTTLLATLNTAPGFDGSQGWRVPTFIELNSIIADAYPCSRPPPTIACVDPAFGPYMPTGFSSCSATRWVEPAWFRQLNIDTVDGLAGHGDPASESIILPVRGGY